MINALIVDDDMATVEVVRNAVHWKQLGVENVSKAYNIEQAKKILLNEPINLVISDVEMPMGSGLDLLRWFREQKMDGEFLLLTCHEDFSYASEALHNRAAEYLLKPFDVDVMEVALRRIIIRIKEQQALKKNSELGVWVKDNYDEVQLSFWNSVLEGRFEEKPQQAAQEIAKRQLALDPQADYTLIVGRLTNLAKDETRFGRDLLLFAVKNVFSELLCGRPENDSILCNDRHTEILVTAICSEGQEMESLTAQRAEVVKQMRRKDVPPELADQRMILTCQIAKLRKEDKIAERAIKRIQRTRESNRIDQENRNQHTNNKTRSRDSSRQR